MGRRGGVEGAGGRGVGEAVGARLARRQLPLVGIDGLIEYPVLYPLSAGSARGVSGGKDFDWVQAGGMTPRQGLDRAGSEIAPPTGSLRGLSAAKALRRLPWGEPDRETGRETDRDTGRETGIETDRERENDEREVGLI